MRTNVAALIAGLFVLAFAPAALAQSTAQPVITGYLTTSGCPAGQTSCFVQFGAAGPSGATVITNPLGVTSTQIGSTVTTHGTFQAALAASASRKGCLIVNSSADTEYVFFGATGSATTSNAAPVAAGGAVSCVSGGIVLQDNIAISSQNTDGATYVVVSQ